MDKIDEKMIAKGGDGEEEFPTLFLKLADRECFDNLLYMFRDLRDPDWLQNG